MTDSMKLSMYNEVLYYLSLYFIFILYIPVYPSPLPHTYIHATIITNADRNIAIHSTLPWHFFRWRSPFTGLAYGGPTSCFVLRIALCASFRSVLGNHNMLLACILNLRQILYVLRQTCLRKTKICDKVVYYRKSNMFVQQRSGVKLVMLFKVVVTFDFHFGWANVSNYSIF